MLTSLAVKYIVVVVPGTSLFTTHTSFPTFRQTKNSTLLAAAALMVHCSAGVPCGVVPPIRIGTVVYDGVTGGGLVVGLGVVGFGLGVVGVGVVGLGVVVFGLGVVGLGVGGVGLGVGFGVLVVGLGVGCGVGLGVVGLGVGFGVVKRSAMRHDMRVIIQNVAERIQYLNQLN